VPARVGFVIDRREGEQQVSLERASSTQQRKALELANLFVKMGVGFVPMPVASNAEYDTLVHEALEKLAEMEKLADEPVGAERKAP
jgi:hypothetical protein